MYVVLYKGVPSMALEVVLSTFIVELLAVEVEDAVFILFLG
jgi:hypothetical protein